MRCLRGRNRLFSIASMISLLPTCLFDTGKEMAAWRRGMEAMDGPINFGERDRWWGLVVEGFQEPMYCMNYNYPYYQACLKTTASKIFLTRSVLAWMRKKTAPENVRPPRPVCK